MIYYSPQVYNDLDDILEGLTAWQKHVLTHEFCLNYVLDIIDICDSIDDKPFHLNAFYEIHKRYGKKVHKYSRNRTTTWYIIYDIDSHNNVFINKIISNHLTVS